MFVDPFSAEYAESRYNQRAEMYADSWFDQDSYDDVSGILGMEYVDDFNELVDDLPF